MSRREAPRERVEALAAVRRAGMRRDRNRREGAVIDRMLADVVRVAAAEGASVREIAQAAGMRKSRIAEIVRGPRAG